jgi:predicted transposase/invertase (TIGR01784 family)
VHIEDADHNIIDATDIFPEYIFISVPQFDDQVRRELDEWLYVIKHSEVKPEFKSPYMQLVAEKLSILKMDTEMRNAYLNYKKVIHTYKDAIDTATDKGLSRGRAEGLAEGKIKERRAIAKNFLEAGLDKHFIAKNTGLTDQEIDDL